MRIRKTKTMWAAAAAIVALGTGCDNSTSSSTPAPTTTPTSAPSSVTNTNAVLPTPADPLASVANRSRIKDDPNATKIDPPKAATLVTGFATITRESPRGTAMETIETTANVNEVARDGDYTLIVYPDPKGGSKTYAAWVYKDALEAGQWALTPTTEATGKSAIPATTNKLACMKGLTHMRTTHDFCGTSCKDDSGCDAKTGQICDGLAFKVDESTNKTENTRYCIPESSHNANDSHGQEHGTLPK